MSEKGTQSSFLGSVRHNLENHPTFQLPTPEQSIKPAVKLKIKPLPPTISRTGRVTHWKQDCPTEGQIRDITNKCKILGIKTPYEDLVRTPEEAQKMQLELKTELEYRNVKRKRERELKRQKQIRK